MQKNTRLSSPRRLYLLLMMVGATTLSASLAAADGGPITPTESAPMFNGEDLTGWVFDVPDVEESALSITQENGVVRFTGEPVGALLTEAEYTDYIFALEWRWPEGAGNSGVLVHASGSRVAGAWPPRGTCW